MQEINKNIYQLLLKNNDKGSKKVGLAEIIKMSKVAKLELEIAFGNIDFEARVYWVFCTWRYNGLLLPGIMKPVERHVRRIINVSWRHVLNHVPEIKILQSLRLALPSLCLGLVGERLCRYWSKVSRLSFHIAQYGRSNSDRNTFTRVSHCVSP